MSDPTPPLTQNPYPPKTPDSGKGGMSTGAKVGIGCGAGCLGLVVILAIVGAVFALKAKNYAEAFDQEFADLGITEVVEGDELRVTTAPTVATYYKGKAVVLDFADPVVVPIAAAATVVQIGGTFEENVYLRSMVAIEVDPDAHFKKELNVKTIAINSNGANFEGGLTGEYKTKE